LLVYSVGLYFHSSMLFTCHFESRLYSFSAPTFRPTSHHHKLYFWQNHSVRKRYYCKL